ncbi:MAG: hypothetical protein HYV07_01285 [Deltaproteobacteria bacterium]|nr:hypothetical protein [Deltaproteobacteria bacterium]
MKHRPYHARNVNAFESQAILDAVRGKRVVVGIDVAKTKMRAALLL